MTRLLIAIALLAVLAYTTGMGDSGKLREETYIVRQGDSLWSIASEFMAKNTFGRREHREFMEGIYELNYEAVFREREQAGRTRPKEVFPGDVLRVRYWVEESD